jgi:threonine/homoserine/homoserine lactone efflux protein
MIESQLLALLVQGAALGLTAASSPGTFQTFLITQTLSAGWRRGAVVALAPLLSDPLIILLVLFLLNNLPPLLTQVISLLGGAFAIYLAWELWKNRLKGVPASETPPSKESGSVLGRAVLMNFLSPGPYTFWTLVCGPILLAALEQGPVYAAAFLTGFYSLFIGGMLVLVLLFHQARRLGKRVVHGLTLASIVILSVFGVVLIWQGLAALR